MIANVNTVTEQLFIHKTNYRVLSEQHKRQAITYNDMVKSIQGLELVDQSWLMQQVNQNLSYRRAYQQLLKKLSFSYSPKQVAASSFEEFSARTNDYFSINFKRDKTFDQQVYVLLSIAHPLSRHMSSDIELHVCDTDTINKLTFPPLSEGKTQQLLNMDDDLLQSLLNSNSELYLS